jgi:hypothetical protein
MAEALGYKQIHVALDLNWREASWLWEHLGHLSGDDYEFYHPIFQALDEALAKVEE